MRWLQDDIEYELSFHQHGSLDEIIHKAVFIEQKLNWRKSRSATMHKPSQPPPPPLRKDFKAPPLIDNKPRPKPKIEESRFKPFKHAKPD